MPSSAVLRLSGPFDLPLSLEAAASFLPRAGSVPAVLRVATRVDCQPVIIEIRQTSRTPPVLKASATVPLHRRYLPEVARWLVTAELDLRPFYRMVASHPIMGPVAKSLRGLKPLRPLSLFEMVITAITEQQLSLVAAFHIRTRLIHRLGSPIEDLWVFPTPAGLAKASLGDLKACGLSSQKAEYVREIAARVANGALDLDALKQKTTAEVHAHLVINRGFGDWSAQYILARGLGRPDCLPVGDTGLRRVVGKYLSRGHRLSPRQLELALSPFAPFRGLTAFYLSVAARHQPGRRPVSKSATRP